MKKRIIFGSILIIMGLCCACTQQAETTSRNSDQSPPERGGKENEIYAVGDTVLLSDLEMTVASQTITDVLQNGSTFYFEPTDAEANDFLVVVLSITNHAKQKIEVFPLEYYPNKDLIVTAVCEDEEYVSTYLTAYVEDFHTREIRSGKTERGILVFEIPQKQLNDQESKLQLYAQLDQETVIFELK